jgi:hypothetical protein
VTTRETVHSGFYSVVDLKSMADNSPGMLSPINFESENKSLMRTFSAGTLKIDHSEFDKPAPTKISNNLTEFLGTMDEEEDEDDMFF